MENRILYEDSDIRIEHYPTSNEDYLLFLKKGEVKQYIISRGCLKEITRTLRDGLELIMNNINPYLIYEAKNRGLNADSIALAMTKAYNENERRKQEIIRTIKLEEECND